MAWCPKCKSEYVDGITKCVDCNCDLVEELEAEMAEDEWELSVNEEDQMEGQGSGEEAVVMDEALLEQILESGEFAFENPEEVPKYVTPYVNNQEKAEENRSSAYTLLIVGCLGLVFIIMYFFDMLPIHRTIANKYMVSGVMGVMFILFIIMGLVSMKNSRVLAKKAHTENNLTTEIRKWCKEKVTAASIDDMLPPQETEEIKYFQRCEKMKELIQNQFMHLDESYLDRLIDEMYPEIFEDGQA